MQKRNTHSFNLLRITIMLILASMTEGRLTAQSCPMRCIDNINISISENPNDPTTCETVIGAGTLLGKVSGGEFALYQNTPNPVSVETKIGFNLPTESSAKVTIYNMEGKVIMVKKGDYKAGYNEININKSDLNANGVMYYRLETPEHTATKKMIIIE